MAFWGAETQEKNLAPAPTLMQSKQSFYDALPVIFQNVAWPALAWQSSLQC